jgi:magnesium transporter
MTAENLADLSRALNRRFLLDYPRDAAHCLERMTAEEAGAALSEHAIPLQLPVWDRLNPDAELEIFRQLPAKTAHSLLRGREPGLAAALLSRMEADERSQHLTALDPAIAGDLQALMDYPDNTAGRMMHTRVAAFRPETTVSEALQRLRTAGRSQAAREIFLVDDDKRLISFVDIQDLALAGDTSPLGELARPVQASVQALDPQEDVVAQFERYQSEQLPVIDVNGRLLGVIHHAGLVQALQSETSADIQTMVGAGKDERALSSAWFAVRKRMPWMQINLATAFLAATVVGFFESTIAQFTALAVLLPVVAGQSGNAGAQAQAVTMRGLALREIRVRHWLQITFKEMRVGLLNGIAVALTAAAGVYAWSRNLGLALVIAIAMVVSMVTAGVAGALVPITLTRLGQDPAQSSSIVLTTITDVAGFLSFLGIATLLSALLG